MKQIDTKLKRLETLRTQRPKYTEVYDFYTGLCRFFQQQQERWLDCTPDLENWETRRRAGFPLLTVQALEIDEKVAGEFIAELISALVALGQEGQSELQKLLEAHWDRYFSCAELLGSCFARDRAPLQALAADIEVPPALLEYVFSTALAFALQQWCEGASLPSLEGWNEGYCPVCGGSPSMGELAGLEGEKKLHCSICATAWTVTRLRCCYCGNTETDTLEYFTAAGETGYRVDLCRKCSGYLKVVDSRELGEGLPMDIEDLSTMHLDLLAQKEGFAKGKRSPQESSEESS